MKKLKLLACGAAIAAMIACVSGCTFTIGGKTSYSYKNSDDYVVGDREISDKVDSIDVDYISGDVKIVTADTDVITIKETAKKHSYISVLPLFLGATGVSTALCISQPAFIKTLISHLLSLSAYRVSSVALS